VKRGATFIPTKLGISLIEALEMVDGTLVTPETRRRVEEYMELIERGEMRYGDAMEKALAMYEQLYARLEERLWDVAKALAEGAGGEDKKNR